MNDGTMLSTQQQDDRINKMFAASGDEGYRLLYLWVKQKQIGFKEFKELMDTFTKE